MAKVSFRLVMPERELLATEADMVVVPGSEGDFGVLPGHAPLISTVRPGVIEVFQGSKAEQRFLSQPFHVAEVFTGISGKFVQLEDTVKSFKAVVDGEYDHLPESAFYMVGGIEEAVEKAKKMAAEV